MVGGIILINKEKCYTSHDVVTKIKHIFNTKVGHTGTLDPNATGLLPILIGDGTKLSAYLINHDKEYLVKLKLGTKTDTADSEGKILKTESVDIKLLEEENIKKVLESFLGITTQIPPMYSAIKVNGKKLYEYARKNIQIEVKPRKIEIYNIQLKKISKESREIDFTVKCSKGTYIRTLCEDISAKLGTVGYMKELKRLVVGEFNLKESITISELEQNIKEPEYINSHIITIEDFFTKYEKLESITLDEKELKLFLNGTKLNNNLKDGNYKIYNKNKEFIGIGKVQKKLLKREIVVEKK